jgi:hypothetical protein
MHDEGERQVKANDATTARIRALSIPLEESALRMMSAGATYETMHGLRY